MQPLIRLLTLFAALTLLPAAATARNISMLSVEWIPHFGASLPEQGLTTALVKAAFTAAGHASDVDFVPWTQALRDVKDGRADIVMGAYRNYKRDIDYYFSEPVYFLDTGFIARPGLKQYTYQSLHDLSPYRIGVSRGWANTEEFEAADFLNKEVAKNPTLNVRKLFRGRIDMTVMNFDLFRYETRKEGYCIGDIEFMEPPLDSQPLYIMASRKISDYQGIIEDFNRGLDQIRRNGSYQRIVNRFHR